MKLSFTNGLLRSFVLMLLLAMSGCAGLRSAPRIEPAVIVIRNSTSQNIQSVMLCDGCGDPSTRAQYGEISPVPVGVSQSFIRPDDPKPLPEMLLVSWDIGNGNKISRPVNVDDVLNGMEGTGNEILVFEITESGVVNVFLEN